MAPNPDASVYELLLEAGKTINSEVELTKLVQKVTDLGTQLSKAQFGAFFYNDFNPSGEKYLLYTISGVPKEAFSKFPMPRNTAVFHPTFAGTGTVRYHDVTKEGHYGKNDPHFGMPRGHLPVTSYLATPVKSPMTGEVIGGLFFGHSEPGIFTEQSEKLIEGLAAQAAIAVENAQLFEEKKRAEQKLLEQREQYRSIFQSTTDAMIIFDESGSVIDANLAALDLLNYSHDELKTKKGNQLLPSSDQLFSAIESIIKSGRQHKGIAKVQTSKGANIDTKITATKYQVSDQTHMLIILSPLEAEKRIEEALVKSEAFAETITNVSPVTLWMTNERAETIYINQTWINLVGGKFEDQLGTGWLNSIIEEDRHLAGTVFMEAFNSRKVFSQDFRIKLREGSIRWVSAYGSPYYLPNGAFGGFAGSLTDITDRKESEQQLSSQNTLINTITNNTMQALFLMDDKQFCTYMNPAAEQMTGYKMEEVKEKPLHDYVHHTHPDGRHFPIHECPIDRALPERMQTTGEEIFIRKNGEFFPVAFVASPILDNGKPIGTVIEVRETSEEKKIQEALRNKEKEALLMLEEKVKERTAELEKTNYELIQFTSVASHDLKEPVRKVSIFSQRAKDLAKDFPDPQFHLYLDNVTRSAGRMARLIDDLLDFARLSQAELITRPVNLNELLSQIQDDLQISIAEKGATFEAKALPTVKGVELQLGQVFQNLISNSLKFAHPSRRPHISISCEETDGFYIIHYCDNGIGFSDDMSERIFEIFERLNTKDQYEGTGIGLAIVKKIITLHGGSITASGKPGEGATFRMLLPQPE